MIQLRERFPGCMFPCSPHCQETLISCITMLLLALLRPFHLITFLLIMHICSHFERVLLVLFTPLFILPCLPCVCLDSGCLELSFVRAAALTGNPDSAEINTKAMPEFELSLATTDVMPRLGGHHGDLQSCAQARGQGDL